MSRSSDQGRPTERHSSVYESIKTLWWAIKPQIMWWPFSPHINIWALLRWVCGNWKYCATIAMSFSSIQNILKIEMLLCYYFLYLNIEFTFKITQTCKSLKLPVLPFRRQIKAFINISVIYSKLDPIMSQPCDLQNTVTWYNPFICQMYITLLKSKNVEFKILINPQ